VLATLLYTREELEVLLMSVGIGIATIEQNLRVARASTIRAQLTNQWTMLNSLRTSLTEARWSLMTPGQIKAERQALAEARAAGIID
jgi:hypothetical protein